MRIDILTLFPHICEAYLEEGVIGRGIRNCDNITVKCHNIRDYTLDKHRRVDDKAFGGGVGMVMQADPIYRCVQAVLDEFVEFESGGMSERTKLLYMSPQGQRLTQQFVKEFATLDHIVILCGRYEGVDERVIQLCGFEKISAGDYVVSGGELPALILTDAVLRLMDGVLPSEEAYENDSHWQEGVLEYPQYTRPAEWRGMKVPDVLLSGNHAEILKWKNENRS